jgi:hypothetical protein
VADIGRSSATGYADASLFSATGSIPPAHWHAPSCCRVSSDEPQRPRCPHDN